MSPQPPAKPSIPTVTATTANAAATPIATATATTTAEATATAEAEATPSPSVVPVLQETEVRPVINAISIRQQCEKTWLLSRGGFDVIDKLVIATPGFTFVSSRPVDEVTAPFIRVSTESVIAANAITAAVNASKHTLEIRARHRLFGEYVLIEVLLPPTQRLKSIACEGNAFAVVEDGVLSDDQPELTLRGAGGLFLSLTSELRAQRLRIAVTGTGHVQAVAPSIVLADQLDASMTAPGSLRIFTNSVQASSIKLASLGSGQIQLSTTETRNVLSVEGSTCGSGRLRIDADTLRALQLQLSVTGTGGAVVTAKQGLEVETIRGIVKGSGDLRFGCTQSTCRKADLSILGSGFIDAQDVACAEASVHIAGSGCTKFRAQDVSTRVFGSGEAVLVGEAPTRMRGNVHIAPSEPPHIDALSIGQGDAVVVPTRMDAFECCIRTSDHGWTTLSTMLGVLQDIWDDWTSPSLAPPMAVPAPASAGPAVPIAEAAATAAAAPAKNPA